MCKDEYPFIEVFGGLTFFYGGSTIIIVYENSDSHELDKSNAIDIILGLKPNLSRKEYRKEIMDYFL